MVMAMLRSALKVPEEPRPELVVKHTFLEFVDFSEGCQRIRASTDSAALAVQPRQGMLGGSVAYFAAQKKAQNQKEGPDSVGTPPDDSRTGTDRSPTACEGPRRGRAADPPGSATEEGGDSATKTAAEEEAGTASTDEGDSDTDLGRTTLMMRNLPNNYTRSMLLMMLDSNGFAGGYDFVYLPMDFGSSANLGYAFVNLVSASVVQRFWGKFDGFSDWDIPSSKVCHVDWSGPHQGLEAHVERYRNSPVMHKCVPDGYKPVLFQEGLRVPFPPPTKAVQPPRARRPDAHGGRRRFMLAAEAVKEADQ